MDIDNVYVSHQKKTLLTFDDFQGPVEHCTIGVQLLSVLTNEMNQVSEADANRSLTKHRKIASSFRDQQLLDIFRLCCTLLKSALESRKTINFDDGLQVDKIT